MVIERVYSSTFFSRSINHRSLRAYLAFTLSLLRFNKREMNKRACLLYLASTCGGKMNSPFIMFAMVSE